MPERLYDFMYALMKEVRRDSLLDFIEECGISQGEYNEIDHWFKKEFGIKL